MPGMLVGMWEEEEGGALSEEEEGGAPLTFQSTDIPVHRNVLEGGESRRREEKKEEEGRKEKMRKNIPCTLYTYTYVYFMGNQ